MTIWYATTNDLFMKDPLPYELQTTGARITNGSVILERSEGATFVLRAVSVENIVIFVAIVTHIKRKRAVWDKTANKAGRAGSRADGNIIVM